ncbi:nucleoside hydrolase [Cellulomonas sp. KRMCY2]|uniref:nucleoside hydrolase n=1 Tax=Cellulomonas sp. KRMCY2 TaxID=1304865 RepID=UPI00045EAE6C|nr:nucleoside hydrolase [Cellulomonas sp. KRMCY2]
MAPRMRVITDNDYAGDPDGLFQLAHLLLSPSVDVRAVIGSHLRAEDPFDPSPITATKARAAADVVVDLLGLTGRVTTLEGSNTALADRFTPIRSAAAEAIVAEAMRESDLPLYVTLGAGLTELASAYLLEPRIAERLTAVWIGGPEHPGLAVAPPRAGGPEVSEYNLRIDVTAAQVVFDSPIPLWQVPRDAYRQAIMSVAELETRVRPHGAIGEHLVASLEAVNKMAAGHGFDFGEVYILGDSPLVLLTALQSSFEPDPSSSRYVTLSAPTIDDDGRYVARPDGRWIRVYTHLDLRLMLEDMVAKLARHAAAPKEPA